MRNLQPQSNMRLEMLKKKKKSHVSKHRQPAGHHERNIEKKVVGFSTEAFGDLFFLPEILLADKSTCERHFCTFFPFGICRCASLARRRRRRSRRARTSLPTLKKVEEEEGGGESPGGVSSGRQRSRNSCKQRRQKVETCQIQVLSFFSAPRSISCSLYCPVATGK